MLNSEIMAATRKICQSNWLTLTNNSIDLREYDHILKKLIAANKKAPLQEASKDNIKIYREFKSTIQDLMIEISKYGIDSKYSPLYKVNKAYFINKEILDNEKTRKAAIALIPILNNVSLQECMRIGTYFKTEEFYSLDLSDKEIQLKYGTEYTKYFVLLIMTAYIVRLRTEINRTGINIKDKIHKVISSLDRELLIDIGVDADAIYNMTHLLDIARLIGIKTLFLNFNTDFTDENYWPYIDNIIEFTTNKTLNINVNNNYISKFKLLGGSSNDSSSIRILIGMQIVKEIFA